jgi:cobalamin biosynthesis protein CobD/CbiB
MGLILMTLFPCYTYYAWAKKNSFKIGSKTPKKHIIVGIILLILIIITQFLNYIVGIMYLINIVMSLVISTLILMISIAGNSVIEETLKKSTILRSDAKKYVFYWLLFICLLGTFALVVFSGEDLFLDINWVNNFMNCTHY